MQNYCFLIYYNAIIYEKGTWLFYVFEIIYDWIYIKCQSDFLSMNNLELVNKYIRFFTTLFLLSCVGARVCVCFSTQN